MMASVPCNNSELEGLETAEGEQRNGADPDHEHRERAQIAVEPKRSLYAHKRPQSYQSNHFAPARSPVIALSDWSPRRVDWFKCGGRGSSPLCHSGASRLRPGMPSYLAER